MRFALLFFTVLWFSVALNAQCFITQLNVNISACDPVTNEYNLSGTVEFVNAPTGSQLVVMDTASGLQSTYNPPFVSPLSYNINGINSSGQITAALAYFTADSACSAIVQYVAPPACGCNASAGTSIANVVGVSNNDYILCDGDFIDIVSNGDYIPSQNATAPGVTYAIYECAPNPTVDDPNQDPCYTGYITGGIDSFNDQNVGGSNGGLLGALISGGVNITNNTVWYVPFVLMDSNTFTYDVSCSALGTPVEVTYLNPIVATEYIDTANGTVTVVITGGYAEFFPGSYSITNTGPGALYPIQVSTHGGSFTIYQLNASDNYSYSISDTNGCVVSGSGTMPVNTSIAESSVLFNVNIFPNPAKNFITVQLAETTNGTVAIFDAYGRLVKQQTFSDVKTVIDLAELSKGYYIVETRLENGMSSRSKFVVSR